MTQIIILPRISPNAHNNVNKNIKAQRVGLRRNMVWINVEKFILKYIKILRYLNIQLDIHWRYFEAKAGSQ